jgi:PPOX class probable F420-dependent enzyme
VQIPRELADSLLEHWPVARLASADASGAPTALPIVFVHVRGYLWSPIDGKPKRDGEPARVQRIAKQPRVEILLDEYLDDWSQLWWLRVQGDARVITPPHPERDPDVAPVLAALRAKYPQYQRTPVLREPATLIAVRPLRVRSWCAGAEALARLRGGA